MHSFTPHHPFNGRFNAFCWVKEWIKRQEEWGMLDQSMASLSSMNGLCDLKPRAMSSHREQALSRIIACFELTSRCKPPVVRCLGGHSRPSTARKSRWVSQQRPRCWLHQWALRSRMPPSLPAPAAGSDTDCRAALAAPHAPRRSLGGSCG